jgi:hypothetical protein
MEEQEGRIRREEQEGGINKGGGGVGMGSI